MLPTACELGPLETKILHLLWEQGYSTVSQFALHAGLNRANTTIATTLNRLYRKNVLHRRQQGRTFYYSAAYSRSEMQVRAAVKRLRDIIFFGAQLPPLSHLVEEVSRRDARLLDELLRLIDARQDLSIGRSERSR
jgi:predicted transcriptional regulator